MKTMMLALLALGLSSSALAVPKPHRLEPNLFGKIDLSAAQASIDQAVHQYSELLAKKGCHDLNVQPKDDDGTPVNQAPSQLVDEYHDFRIGIESSDCRIADRAPTSGHGTKKAELSTEFRCGKGESFFQLDVPASENFQLNPLDNGFCIKAGPSKS